MAGQGQWFDGLSPLDFFSREIRKAYNQGLVNIVTTHTRDHFYGEDLYRSCVYRDIDPYKITTAVIFKPRKSKYSQSVNGVHSVAFESEFDHSIGYTDTPHKKGFYYYTRITENSDPLTNGNYPYVAATALISSHWVLKDGCNIRTKPEFYLRNKDIQRDN